MIFFSSYETIYWLLPLAGFIIGLFGTMLGGGGGFFFLPLLTLVFSAPAHVAVATSLTATLPICMVGSWGHYRRGNTDLKAAVILIFAGVVGALSGAALAGVISDRLLKMAFGIYSVVIAINMGYNTWQKRKVTEKGEKQKYLSKSGRILRGTFFGLFAGAIAGIFGTSGTAPVLAGLFSMRLPLKIVIGTSLMVVLVNTVFASGAHFLVGQIDLTLVSFLSVGSLLGAMLGTRFLAKVKVEKKESNVRYVYALVMVAIGVLMIFSK